MADDEEIRVRATLRDELSLPAERAARAVDHLGDEAAETAVQLEAMGAAADDAGGDLDDLTTKTDKLTRAQISQQTAARQARGENGRFASSQKKVTEEVDRSTRAFGGLHNISFKFRRLFKVLKFGLIADGVTFLATALKGLGAAAYAGLAGLSPITGMVIALPGALAAAAQGFVALKIGAKGLGELMKVMSDPEATAAEINAAMKGMARSQVLFARALLDTKEEREELRKIVSGSLFQGLDKEVDRLARVYFPMLNEKLGETGKVLNRIAKYTTGWLTEPKEVENFGKLMDGNNVILENLGKGASEFGRAFLWVLRAALPMMTKMSEEFHGMMERFTGWAKDNQPMLRKFFLNSYKTFKGTMKTLGDFWMGLLNIGKLSDSLSDHLGDSFSKMGRNFREWTESTEGKKSIRQFFQDMIPIVDELGRWIRDISIMLGDITMNNPEFLELSGELRTNTLPLLTEFLQKTSGKFLPILTDLLELLNKMADAGLLDAFVTVIDGVITAVDGLIDVINGLPEPLADVVFQFAALMSVLKVAGFLGAAKGAKGAKGGGIVAGILGALGLGGIASGKAGGGKPGKPGKHRAGGAPAGKAAGKAGWLKNFFLSVPLPALGAWGNDTLPSMRPEGYDPSKSVSQNKGWTPEQEKKYQAALETSEQRFGGTLSLAEGLLGTVNTVADAIGAASRMSGDFKGRVAALPKRIQTMIQTPGVITSLEYIDVLRKQYDLTPRQVRTLVAVSGVVKTLKDVRGVAKKYDLLSKDVVSVIKTNNVPVTMEEIRKLKKQYDLTPEHVDTLINVMADQAWATMQRLDTAYTGLSQKEYWITVKTRGRGANFRNSGEDVFFAGGTPTPGMNSLVGELGPEAMITRGGKISMVGLNGPEIRKFSAGTAILPASATADPFGGETGNAPSWAVDALRNAAGGDGVGTLAGINSGGSKGSDGPAPITVSIGQIVPQTEMDVEAAVLRAIEKADRERRERQ